MQEFASNPDVSFGDVNLSEDQVRGNHNPGAGGWPTVKYFNKQTGYEGAPYDKKTDKAMCDELGDQEMMDSYIMEAGQTSKCSVETGVGCSAKELKYIETWKEKSSDEVSKQLTRLTGMSDAKLKPDARKWISQRIAALKQLVAPRDEL